MFRKIVTYITIYSFLFSQTCFAAMITPDGRTQTTVNVNGHVYDVTTSTVSGQNAFNSFSNFDVYQGTTVNLYLPGSTLNLINLVRDKKTNIDGILNSIKNGQIGGNVFILNPHGVAIGQNGVVNVGSLMLSTPNKEFMDQIIGKDGSISELATKSVLAGDLPIDPSGVISVKGKIKALDSVSVKGGNVVNTGEILANLKPTQASDIMNTDGIDLDSPLAFKDGKIGIFAENDVVNSGTIRADATTQAKAGDIVIKAGNDIKLEQGTKISANGSAQHKDGGSVVVFADNKSNLEQGAVISADAYDNSAAGGFVELSALKEVNLNGGTMSASGINGLIFIDPETLNITSDAAYAGQDNIYALANNINVKKGVSLVKENGNVTLIARDTDAGWVKKSSAFLNIEDNATIKGKNVYLYALAGDAEVLDGIVTGETTEDNGTSALTGILETIKAKGLEFFEAITDNSFFVGYSGSTAEAGINIGKNVTIAADEEVKINSKVVSNSETSSLGTLIDVSVAENEATSSVFVDKGTTISGNTVSIVSDVSSTTLAEADTKAYGDGRGVPVDIAVAVGITETNNTIDIKNGATISSNGDLNIEAKTTKSHEVSASGVAYQDGWAAAGVAYSTSQSNNNVLVGGTITGDKITINSDIRAIKNSSSGGSTVGTGFFDKPFYWAGTLLLDGLSKWISLIPARTHSQSNVKLAMSGGVSYSSHENNASSKVFNNYSTGDNASSVAATSIDGSSVTISSSVLDMISNYASASVSTRTNDDDHSGDQNKENSFAGAVGYGKYINNSYAEIGEGVTVNASSELKVTSETRQPVVWPNSSIFDVFKNLEGNVFEKGSQILDNIDTYFEENPINFFTSLVKSSAETSTSGAKPGEEAGAGIIGVAGAVNIMNFDNSSQARIADGAMINQKYNPENTNHTSLAQAPNVEVKATNYSETLNLSGEYGGKAQYGLGASYLQTWYDNEVSAVIGSNAKLYSNSLNVKADSTLRNLSIAGAAGYQVSETFGFQGTFNWLKLDSDVLAHISSGADVSATGSVLVEAKTTNDIVNVVGGATRSSQIGIGASAAINDINQISRAVIGDFTDTSVLGNVAKIKGLSGASVSVNAANESDLYTISIAGTIVKSDDKKPTGGTGTSGGSSSSSSGGQSSGNQQKQKFGVGISGTASYNNFTSQADAYINNADLSYVKNGQESENQGKLAVSSVNNNDILTVGGGLTLAITSGNNLGMAGAVGINKVSDSRSVAFINNSKIDNFISTNVKAAANGEIFALSESAAGAFGEKGGTIAGSVSVNEIDNLVQAYISNADENDTQHIKSDSVSIWADNSSDIFSQAGNISGAKTAAVGTSIATNDIDNETKAYASNSKFEGISNGAEIKAENNSAIETSSAGVAVSDKAGISGSVSVNNINNTTYAYADSITFDGGNIRINGTSDSVINFYGGTIAGATGAVGGGGTVTTNIISEDTLAEIRNNSTINRDNEKDEQSKVEVAADTKVEINNYSVNAGLGKYVGVGANVSVNKVNSQSVARIKNSTIDGNPTDRVQPYNYNPFVSVQANNQTLLESHAGVLGASGVAGVGLSSVTTVINKDTIAEVLNSQLESVGDVDIGTDSKTYFNSVVVGGAGGKVGVAGNVNVVDINNTNRALIDASTVYALGNLSTTSKDVTRMGKRLNSDGEEDFAVAVGAGAVGYYNGTGASVLVSNINNKTTSEIRNSNVDVLKKLTVKADSDSSIDSYVYAAGLGIYSGAAGAISVNTINNDVEALITQNSGKLININETLRGNEQKIEISADNQGTVNNMIGSAAVGLGSGGASVDVTTIDGKTTAGTVGSMNIYSQGDIDVKANAERQMSMSGMAGSGGAGTVGGAVSVMRIGSNYTEAMQEQTSGILETVNQEISRNNEYQEVLENSAVTPDVNLSDFDKNVDQEFSTSVSKDVGTSAFIGSGADVTYGGKLAINATDKVVTDSTEGQFGVGGASIGASVSVTDVRNAAKAYIGGNSKVVGTGNLEIKSLTDSSINAKTMGGNLGGSIVVGGSVVNVNADSTSQAYIGNGAQVTAKDIDLEAKDKAEIEALAAGVNASTFAAAGASVSIVNKTNDVQAFVGDGSSVNGEDFQAKSLDEVNVSSQAIAGAAGTVSGEGSYAESSIVSKIKSYVGKVAMTLAGLFNLSTAGSSVGNAESLGVNAGVYSVGASIADSNIDLDNQASVGEGAIITADSAYIGAGQLKADALADSLAAAGALIGGNGAISLTDVGGQVKATVGDAAQFKGTDKVEIISVSDSGQAATASGYRGGILAAGVVLADAKGHLDVSSSLGAVDLTTDELAVKATGTDILYADTVSGSGGIISGAAAVSETDNDSTTKVSIGTEGKDAKLDLKTLELAASRTSKQNATSNSVNASVVGASGARADNTSNSVSKVDLAGNTEILVNDADIKAENKFIKDKKYSYDNGSWTESDEDYNIQSGSGGVLDAPAVISKSNIANEATVNFGKNTIVDDNKKRNDKDENKFIVSALNDVVAVDKAKLVSGGALAITDTISSIDNSKNKTSINFDGRVETIDDMIVSANSNADLTSEVYVNTYGLSGVAMGSSDVRTVADNSINFAQGSYTMTYGDMYLYAGQSYEGSSANKLKSRVYLWNNTALPFSDPDIGATIDMSNLVNINAGATVKSGQDINITSEKGISIADALSSAKNPYNQLLSLEDKAVSGTINNNSRIALNGDVAAGVNSIQSYIIDENGRLSVTIGEEQFYDDDELYHQTTNEKLYSNIIDEIKEAQALRAEYIDDEEAVAFYDAEIAALQAKLALMGLFDPNDGGLINVSVDYITLGDISAKIGAVNLTTQNVEGKGSVNVSNDARVTIENNSSAFLRVSDIAIAERSGGSVTFNGTQIKGKIGDVVVNIATASGEDPSINIASNAVAGEGGRSPNIDIDGTLTNYAGSVNIDNVDGSIYVNGNIKGKELKLTAGQDIYQGYQQGFTHVGGAPESAWDAIASANESANLSQESATSTSDADIEDSRSSLIASNNIFLSGRYINLNGLVQSGISDYNLNITDTDVELANGLKSSTALADYNKKMKYNLNYNASPLYKLSDKYGNIGAYYNVLTGQIELNDVRVEGGYIEIYGHILNTSKNSGELMVTDGYGRINIDNQSGKEIVVNNMSLANRISGVIKITDLAKTNANGDYLQTTYTRNGNTINVVDNNGTNLQLAAVQDGNGKSSTTYSPLENQRYVWQTGQKSVSQTTKTYEGDSFWDMDWLVPDTGAGVTVTGPTPVGEPVRMEDGSRIEISNSEHNYEYEKESYVSEEEKLISHDVESWSEGWWIFSVDKYKTTDVYQTGETHINTHSVKADYDINISFKGYDSGLADINSKSSVILNGVINNQGGMTNITTDDAIVVGSDYARILGQGLTLTANNGIGSNAPLIVDIANGNLNVTNNLSGDVNLKAAQNDFVFQNITNNGGNTSIYANGSILGASTDALISGKQIDLTAQTGAIGSKNMAVKIQTSGDENSSLSALANNDIFLVQDSGDLGLESVTSLTGDVNISVKDGGVFDANTNEVYDNKTVEQLTKIWEDMGLDVGNEEMKQAYLNEKKAEYNTYWQYKSRQEDGAEPEFKFTAAEREALLNKELTESEQQAIGSDKITDEYINRLEEQKTAEYKELAAIYGDESKYGSEFDADWSYTLSAEEEASLAEGAGWNGSQLAYSIFKAKEGDVVDTQYMIEDPNVAGKNVNIEVSGAIGKDAGSETFKLSALSPETDLDKILLISSAERDNLEIGEDGDTVTVSKREDVDIHADSISLKAKDYIYLGGEEDININTVEAGSGKNITIIGAKGIYNVATDANQDNVIGGNLTLEAGEGSIGTKDKALNIKLDDGAKIVARSQNDIFMNSKGGNLLIESMLAQKGTLSLTSNGKLIAETMAEGDIINMQGQNIIIDAESIGDEDNYLTIALGNETAQSHSLTVTSADDANINDIGSNGMTISSATAGGILRLKSDNSIVAADENTKLSAQSIEFNGVSGNIGDSQLYLTVDADEVMAVADGSIYLNNSRSSVFDNIQAGGELNITSAEDLTLTNAVAEGAMNISSATNIIGDSWQSGANLIVQASGDATLNGLTSADDMNVSAVKLTGDNWQSGNTLFISAAEADLDGIGSRGDISVLTDTDSLFGNINSELGNVALSVAQGNALLNGPVQAQNGQVSVKADKSILNVGNVAEGAIIANTVDLVANKGSVGTADKYLTVDSSYSREGWINALAEQGIYIDEVKGDMVIRQFASNGDIDMRVESSILTVGGLNGEPNFKADNITLHSEGKIGTPDAPVVLMLNDNANGKINLQAQQGISVNKIGSGLVSDYIYNFSSGQIIINLPSGHANIGKVVAAGGLDFNIAEQTYYYNIWFGNSDLEAKVVNPRHTEYPSENPIEIMRAPTLERYQIKLGNDLFMNMDTLEDEELLSGL